MWPFGADQLLDTLWGPIKYFGAVAGILCIVIGYLRVERSLARCLVAGCVAGIIGSVGFWSEWEHVGLSGLHGMVWGLLVGACAWYGLGGARAAAEQGDEADEAQGGTRTAS
jgi:hypothetical protein